MQDERQAVVIKNANKSEDAVSPHLDPERCLGPRLLWELHYTSPHALDAFER